MVRWLLLLFALIATPAAAQMIATAASPDKSITLSVAIDRDGIATYAVERRGKPVIAPSRLGFLFTDAPKMERHFKLVEAKTGASDTRWEQPWGEWRSIRDNHVELRVRLKENTRLARGMTVVFRLFDDGFGFRYELPTGANIADELTEFAVASNGTAWWTPGGEWNRYEFLYNRTPLSEVAQAHTPLTVKLDDGTHLAFHEAALVDYSAMWLRRGEGTTLKAVLAPSSGPAKVVKTGAFTTPWRTVLIADNAAGLYAAGRIELNLNAPNALGDVGWVQPMKYVGVWWNMIKGEWSWDAGAKHGATTANVRRYIDFAAANGFGGVLVEGWNVGWETNWARQYFTRPTADFDAPGLAAYAKSKGVSLIGHHETGGASSWYDDQMEAAFAYSASLGQRAVKTGYVADAGQIERIDGGREHREWHDGQWQVNHHMRVVMAGAKHRIAVNAHEPVKDTGLRRTYPNWMTREGARGMEYNAWIGKKNPPEHEANLAFTRMLAGPMDFTPGVLSLTGEKGSPIFSTVAKQLANYVVLYSPLQMAADTPENYAKYPLLLPFIRDVPVDWTDTRVLNGEVGDYATFARKDRNSDDWYLGSVTDEEARTLDVRLDFLDAGTIYTAQIYRDGAGADYRTEARHAIVVEEKRVRRGDRLTLALPPGGGQAIRFAAGRRGRK